MKRLTSLLLCLIFIIGAIVPVTVSANETTPVDGLVEFEGYAARLVDYNGVRAQYLLDTKKLADLEENYDVTIGILIGMGVEDYEALTVDTAKNDLKFYENGAYVGKHEAEKDGKIKFVYAVTFEKEGSATAEKFLTELSFRAYVKLDEEVYYVDSTSERFGAAVSMADVALELAQLDDYKSNELFAGVANTLYPTLYVGYNAGKFENTSLILDFFSATPDSQFVTSANYTDTSKTAQNRFGAQPATYDPFITYRYADADPSKPTNAVTGGTATITSPWKFKNYYGRNYWIFDGGTKTGGSDPALYPDLTDEDALFEVIGVTEYYVTDTIKWTKMTYASSFGEGYFHMGLNSFLEFPEAVKAAKAAGGGSYTIQFVAQRAGGSGQWNAYIGFRPAISESGANVKFISTGTTKYYDQEISASLAGDIDAVNMYTFTFDREDTAAVGLAGYFNTTEWYNITAKEIANDGLYKIFESADANIYAIRVYDYVLSEGEIAQNNFADLAKFFSLDLAGFYSLDGTAKKAVYAATAAFTLSSDKADVQDAVTRAITGAYKLTYNENGDYVWAKPGVSFTLPVATSADKADMFLGYFTAEGVQVTDAKGAMTEGFTIAADTTVEAKFMNMYDSLYVGYNKDKATFENASLILDFFWATEETEIAKSASYTDIDAIAATRFGAQASTYDPFITYRYADANPSKPTNAVTGGTAPITSPWKFNNYYAEGYWKWENKGGTAMDGDGKSSYTGTSVPTTVTGVTEYYISDAGKWAKATYASNFGDGYFHMGKNSFLTFTSAQIEAKETGDGSYTIQFIAQRVGSGYFSSFVGDRVSINQSGKFIKFDGGYTASNLTTYKDFVDTTTTFEGNIDNVNTYTFSFDRADTTAATLEAYVNTNQAYSQTVAETKNEDMAKIFEQADANIYAIRVYSDVLSSDEIIQNNFADIAKFHSLDLSRYFELSDADKKALHNAFAPYTLETIAKADAQALLDESFDLEQDELLAIVTLKANFGVFDKLSEHYIVKGKEIIAPEISLGGSEFLGWSTSADGEVEYLAGEKIYATADMTLYALWNHNTYSVSYNLDGGQLASEGIYEYIAHNESFDIPSATKDGYLFIGWYTDPSFTNQIIRIGYDTYGDLELYAYFVEESEALFELNVSDKVESLGDYSIDFTDSANVLDRFERAKDDIETVNVLPRFDVTAYPISNRVQLYVATNGSDSNSGTIDAPFATINKALTVAKNRGGAVIWVRGGEYRLDSSVDINLAHSGTANSPLIISAYGDETVTFSTVKYIQPSSFASVDYTTDTIASRIPDSVKSKILTVNLYDLGWTEKEIGEISKDGAPSLFIDGELQDIARYPNSTAATPYLTIESGNVIDTGSVTARDGSNLYAKWIKRVSNWEKWVAAGRSDDASYDYDTTLYKDTTETVKDENASWWDQAMGNDTITVVVATALQNAIADAKLLDTAAATEYTDSHGNTNLHYGWHLKLADTTPFTWENDGNIWYYGNVFEGWEYGYYNIATFDSSDKSIKSTDGSSYGMKYSTNSPTGRNTFYLFNAIEALDSAGEWYINYETGDLYIYPTDNFASTEISYASTNTVNAFNVNNARYVILNGMNVDMASGYGVYTRNSKQVVVQGFTFSNSKGGVNFGSSTDCAIIYNDFSAMNETMISVVNSNAAHTLTPDRNIIQNNYIHSPLYYKQGGISIGGCRSVVSHNELVDNRISFSTSVECIVEYNEIRGGSKYESDAGMIYLNGYYNIGNHIRYNYLHDWDKPGNGIYFDDLSSFNYAYYNIIDSSEKTHTKATGFGYTSTGHYNVFYGNITVGRDIDRFNVSALYYSGDTSLGYRWNGLSASYASSIYSRYDQEKLAIRFPEIINAGGFAEKMKTHVTERAVSGYTRNDLEVYLRSPANNIFANNVILGTSVAVNEPTDTVGTSLNYVANNYHSTSSDGVLVDYANGDFTVTSTYKSAIEAAIPNFVQLDASLCGRTE